MLLFLTVLIFGVDFFLQESSLTEALCYLEVRTHNSSLLMRLGVVYKATLGGIFQLNALLFLTEP